MYETRFGLRQRPFPATPDTACYYPATSHERALARLQLAVSDHETLSLLTGPPGTGKTLVCHALLERLGPDVVSAFLTHSHFADRASLLQAILFDLSLPYQGEREQELRLRLTDFLLRTYKSGQRVLLIVDEAQHLGSDHLEELRLLGNLEAARGKAFQVVLVGQPGLLETLRRPELAVLSQRLVARAKLEPLGVEEASDYVRHLVRQAGGRPERILTDDAVELLVRRTSGVPRLLNQAAHQAFLLADAADTPLVDAEAVLEALAAVGLDAGEVGADEAPSAATLDPLPETAEVSAEVGPARLSGVSAEDGVVKLSLAEEQDEPEVLFDVPRRPA
jgi:type II secretory pathway predicted ATPase ExeA